MSWPLLINTRNKQNNKNKDCFQSLTHIMTTTIHIGWSTSQC